MKIVFEILLYSLPFCSGWDVNRLSRRKADLVLSFSFSACMPRISTEKPSWDKKALSPASCSRTRPEVKQSNNQTKHIYQYVNVALMFYQTGFLWLFDTYRTQQRELLL